MLGIDYGFGQTNIDLENGIRYGVISQHSIGSFAFDDLEPVYAGPNCPKCGDDAIDVSELTEETIDAFPQYRAHGCSDYACTSCAILLDSSDVWSEEAIGFRSTDPNYEIDACLDSDLFILRSPFYTFAPFCSPCVPGAGNLDSASDASGTSDATNGVKTYCLGHDWFEDGRAPYVVYRVSDDSIVEVEAK